MLKPGNPATNVTARLENAPKCAPRRKSAWAGRGKRCVSGPRASPGPCSLHWFVPPLILVLLRGHVVGDAPTSCGESPELARALNRWRCSAVAKVRRVLILLRVGWSSTLMPAPVAPNSFYWLARLGDGLSLDKASAGTPYDGISRPQRYRQRARHAARRKREATSSVRTHATPYACPC